MPRKRTVDATLARYQDQLGKVPDHKIAEEAGVSRAAVVNHRKRLGIPAYEGYKFAPQAETSTPRRRPRAKAKAPDAPRRKPGRPPKVKPAVATEAPKPEPAADTATKATGRVRAFRGRRSALDPYVHLLGTRPDREIAELAGVSAENVRAYRVRRGIVVTGTAPTPATAPHAATPAPAPAVHEAHGSAPTETVAAVSPTVRPGTDAHGERTAYSIGWALDGRSGAYVVLASDMRGAAEGAERALASRHPGALLVSIQRVAEVLA